MPGPKEIGVNKGLIVVKAREESDSDEGGFPTGVEREIVFMELTKNVLENLFSVSSVSYAFISGEQNYRNSYRRVWK